MSKKNLADGVKVDMVKADEMTEEERREIFDREASVEYIPDLNILTKHVYDILVYLEKKETVKFLKSNASAVRMLLNEKYAETVPLGIIDILMEEEHREENIDRLLRIFDALKMAKLGKLSLDDGLNKFTDEINNRYLYSKYGSKEEFERALSLEIQKEQRKSNSNNISEIAKMGKVTIKN
jgi:hypothetical protein